MKKKKVEKKWEKEDEMLDLKELMDVQGGIEKDDRNKVCDLGCYNGGTIEGDSDSCDIKGNTHDA